MSERGGKPKFGFRKVDGDIQISKKKKKKSCGGRGNRDTHKRVVDPPIVA